MSKSGRPGGELSRLALLYTSGELDESARAAFEHRLADDQAARDALCAAVRLYCALNDQGSPLPNPAYRDRVHQRLRMGAIRPEPVRHGFQRWQPLTWSLVGAAAAAAILLAFSVGGRPETAPSSAPAATAIEMPAHRLTADNAVDDAGDWPDMMSGKHLAEAVNDENRRKERAESRRIVRSDEPTARLRTAPVYRQ